MKVLSILGIIWGAMVAVVPWLIDTNSSSEIVTDILQCLIGLIIIVISMHTLRKA